MARIEPFNWDYCDRSPCSRLIKALGEWIYGDLDDGSYVIVTRGTTPSEIRYCPFCGTRLDQLELTAGQIVQVPR